MEDFINLTIISNIKHKTIILYKAEYRECKRIPTLMEKSTEVKYWLSISYIG